MIGFLLVALVSILGGFTAGWFAGILHYATNTQKDLVDSMIIGCVTMLVSSVFLALALG